MTSSNLPEGFKPVEAATESRPEVVMVDYDVFQDRGARVLYGGVVDLAPGRERSDVHTFRGHKEPDGQLYGLWRCASLDQQLKRMPIGALLFIQYHGKLADPEKEGFTQHKWTVARSQDDRIQSPNVGAKRRPAAFD